MTSVADRIIALASQLSGLTANRSSRLVEDLELDSMDRIQLAIEVEKEFNIDLPDEDVDDPSLGTIDGLIAYVEGKLTPLTVVHGLPAGFDPTAPIIRDRPGIEL